MPIKANGSVEFSFYHTTSAGPYDDAIYGVISGESISHSSFRILLPDLLKNRVLFDRYIAGNPAIPQNDSLINSISGEKQMSVDISFWPYQEQILPTSAKSKLYDRFHDRGISALGSPMTYNRRFTSYLNPTQQTLAPRIPILSKIFGYTVQMPPFLIFHQNMLKGVILRRFQDQAGNPTKSTSELIAIYNAIVQKLTQYDDKYQSWFKAIVEQQNANHKLLVSNKQLRRLSDATQSAHDELIDYRESLREELKLRLFENHDVTEDQFLDILDDFITFGKPATKIISIPLTEWIDLEILFAYIKERADNPNKYQYNLLSFNCATITLEAFQEATKHCPNKQFRAYFDCPWYVKWLGLPVSPTMIMQQIEKAKAILETEYQNNLSDIDSHLPINKPPLQTKRSATVILPANPELITNYFSVNAINGNAEPMPEPIKKNIKVGL